MSIFSNANFQGQRVLVRVDFNVPLNKETFEVTDDTRIKAAVPTIQHILNNGGSVILMSHLGRPKGGPEDKYSLKHIVSTTSKLLNTSVQFSSDCIGAEAEEKAANLKAGEVLLLENLRFYAEEEKGDTVFAQKLATLGTMYVNDAFGTAHRAHASTAVIAQFFGKGFKMFGLLMEAEVASATRVMKQTEKPFTAIIGGAKVSDKILIIENLLNTATDIIIGGGMAYTFKKAQGGNIGNSLCEDDRLQNARELLEIAKQKGVHIHLPEDSVAASAFSNEAETRIEPSHEISDGFMGLDIGPKAQAYFTNVILASKTILWNGPMGVFEMPNFQAGTKAIAEAVAKATLAGAYSLVGGGDSVAAVNKFGFTNQVSYVSTGGGALLELFEGKVLPGIGAIEE